MTDATDYNTWYVRADQAWTQYFDLEEQHADLCEGSMAEAEEMIVLQQEMEEWKKAAEYAEKMMETLEKCMGQKCAPAQDLVIPFKPWINVGVRLEDGTVESLYAHVEPLS